MVDKKIALACLLIYVLGCLAEGDGDMETLESKCEGRDRCANLSSNFFERNCECDRLCRIFGDCCIDAWGEPLDNKLLRCIPFGTTTHVGVYAISGCPRRADPCAADCLGNDLSDPLLAAPVSSPGGATYRNMHCAACHGADLESLVPWQVLVNCQTLAPHNLSAEFVWENLEHDEYGEWGLQFQGQFHVCDVLFGKPDAVRNVRLCRANVEATCPRDWTSQSVRRLCHSYTAVMYTTEEAYLNPHCALCNGVALDQLFCDRSGLVSPRLRNFSFALLFDMNRSDGDLVGISRVTCPEGQKYDPFLKKCRHLFCAIPGYRMVDEKCVKV